LRRPQRWFRRWWRRLVLRRWLVAVASVVTLCFLVLSDLSVVEGIAGIAVIIAAAGALPRDQVTRRPPRAVAEVPAPADPLTALQRLIGGLPDAAIILAPDGTILAFNTPAQHAYPALKKQSAISTALRHPELIEAINTAAAQQQHQTATVTEAVPVERRLSATVIWFASRPAGERDPAMMILLRDLTEQERIGQMRADFVANASHELRTPLASVLGFIETLRGPARNDEKAREEFLAVMAREAERMKRVIDDLLSLSRVEMKAHLPPTDPVELGEVLEYVRDALERTAAERNIEIEVQPLAADSYVLGEREGLIHVFTNLVNNAIKYGHEGGFVRIVASREDGSEPMLSVAVIDNGRGIAEEHLPRLTERFYRVNVAESRQRGGTGLGLSIVKHVLNRHRGTLRIASTPRQGSRFTVFLPEYKPEHGKRRSAEAAARSVSREPASSISAGNENLV